MSGLVCRDKRCVAALRCLSLPGRVCIRALYSGCLDVLTLLCLCGFGAFGFRCGRTSWTPSFNAATGIEVIVDLKIAEIVAFDGDGQTGLYNRPYEYSG